MTTWGSPRLAAGAETLAARLDNARAHEPHCDVLVIGSGYGGAVAAARMAGQQVTDADGTWRHANVWVVERGREYQPGMFPDRFSDLPGHVRFSSQNGKPARGNAEGLFDVRLGTDVSVLLASGLGGGSLINAGVMAMPAVPVLQALHAAGIDAEALQQAYARVRETILPEQAPLYAKTAVLRTMSERQQQAGFSQACVAVAFADPAQGSDLLRRCTACGDCLTGCNQGAKKTLDTNYLPLAYRRGADMFVGVSVERLHPPAEPGLPWRVDWQFTAPSIRPAGRPALHIRAQRVVLAAGALGSTEILLRSRSPRFTLSPRLGQGFSMNGGSIAAVHRHAHAPHCTADQETDPGDDQARNVGPTITGLVRAVAQEQPIAIEEFAVPAALSRVFGEIVATFRTASPQAEGDEDPQAATGSIIERSGLYGLLGDDGAAGTLVLPSVAPETAQAFEAGVQIRWEGAAELPIFKAQHQWLEDATKGGDGSVVYNPASQPFGLPADGTAVTVHPLGGCGMGLSSMDGVVNSLGEVYADGKRVHPGLAVLDGAIIPRALGINPLWTIAAVAEQAVVELASKWGLRSPEDLAERVLPARQRWAQRFELQRTGTTIAIRERLSGHLTIDAIRYRATLDVQTQVENLPALLEQASKPVAATAQLRLQPADADDDEFSPPSQALAAIRLQLQGQVRILERDPDDDRYALDYIFHVAEQPDLPAPWKPGVLVHGIKKLLRGSDKRSLWRQLSEVHVRIGARVDLEASPPLADGRLALNFDRLADQRTLPITIQHQSSAPDALGDLAALPAYILRLFINGPFAQLRSRNPAVAALDDGIAPEEGRRVAQVLERRRSGPVAGVAPQVEMLNEHGTSLRRYRPAQPAGRPVLLIHGLSAAGSTFTLPALAPGLCGFLLEQRREVWVLDLRTSIANEPADPAQPRPGPWTFEEVALGDIPAALRTVHLRTGQQVDVVAHCIGAAMFSVAALADPGVSPMVGAAVLSQVGPRLRLSAFNRLRGYVASYVEQFLGVDMFDTRPEYERKADPATGQVAWHYNPKTARSLVLLDLLLTTFPYPDDDNEEDRAAGMQVDFRTVRHRADAIFGQLMQLGNVSAEVLAELEAIYGWVKLRTLTQTIHYARLGLVANAAGRNDLLLQDKLRQQMAFPVMLVHGRLNRVFDWRGSLESYRLLRGVRTLDKGLKPVRAEGFTHWKHPGLEFMLLHGHGHQDCMIGHNAEAAVFAPLHTFLQENGMRADRPQDGAARQPEPQDPPISFAEPGLGPVLGAIVAGKNHLSVRLLIHPRMDRARACGLVVVPLDGSPKKRADDAHGLLLVASQPVGARQMLIPSQLQNIDGTQRLLEGALELRFRWDAALPWECGLVIAHTDLDSDNVFDGTKIDIKERLRGAPSLENGLPLSEQAREALIKALSHADRPLQPAALRISEEAVRTAHNDPPRGGGQAPEALRFVLASCQYPAGLLDEACAQAAWTRLAAADPKPAFLLATGDQIYADETAGVFEPADTGSPGVAIDHLYHRAYSLPQRRAVGAWLPTYPILDDHEVVNDWQNGHDATSPELVQAALRRYQHWQGSLVTGLQQGGGRHYRLVSAGAVFEVLDTRCERMLRRTSRAHAGVDLAQARIVPEDVLEAALDRLAAAPPSAAKFLVTSAPVLPMERHDPQQPESLLRSDTWAGYPASVRQLLDGVARRGLQRLVLLCGDAHISTVSSLCRDDGSVVHAVMGSGMYAPWPFAGARVEDFVPDGAFHYATDGTTITGTVVTHARTVRNAFAMLSLQGPPEDPHARLTVVLNDGSTNPSYTIRFPPVP